MSPDSKSAHDATQADGVGSAPISRRRRANFRWRMQPPRRIIARVMLSSSPEPRVRGVVILDQIKLVENRYGREVIEAALDALEPDQATEVRGILAVSWVDVHLVAAFKGEIASHLNRDPLDLQREIVRAAIGQTINGVWRMLLRQFSDAAIIKRTPILYSKTFDRGGLALKTIGEGEATFELTGWPTMPEYDCVGLATGLETILEHAGRAGANVRWERRAPLVLYHATWTRR